jgi:orotidine-5'-phosphate decarboxylase
MRDAVTVASMDGMSTIAGAQTPPGAGAQNPTGAQAATAGFGDRLAELVAARESQLVLGLDPDPARLWPEALDAVDPGGPATSPPGGEASPAMRAARAVAAHCALVIEAVAEHCVAVKPQVACFERLGAPGWAALTETVALARERGLLVIADAKRGDVDVTAAAYAQAFLGETPTPYGPVPGLGADAMTVNPLLGGDSLTPLVTTARANARGLFVLVRTSNPGAADLQERELADGHSVSYRLADLVQEIGAPGIGRHGLSDIGAVVGATAPDRLGALRDRMPHAVFLLPGIGAQGGRVDDLAPAFAAGPASGLISASRSIVTAHERGGGDPACAAAAEASRLRELGWRLAA